jgi:hypothetical protein
VDSIGEVPDLLQDPELVLERLDLDDLAVTEVPDRDVAHLDGFAGRGHSPVVAGVGATPDQIDRELVARRE